jgi:hypothetical protein
VAKVFDLGMGLFRKRGDDATGVKQFSFARNYAVTECPWRDDATMHQSSQAKATPTRIEEIWICLLFKR